MRQIGSLASENESLRFQDYLLAHQIPSKLEQEGERWEVWIIEEDQLETARQALQRFQDDPQAAEFQEATHKAQKVRKQQQHELSEQIRQRKKVIAAERAASRSARLPVTMTLAVLSVLVTIAMAMEDNRYGLAADLSITQYSQSILYSDQLTYIASFPEIRSGQIWRLFTPIFKHFDPIHLLFNMFILFRYGGRLETYFGSQRYLLFILFTAAISNLTQYYVAGPTFGGMSGVNFALFGFTWMKSVYAPHSGLYVSENQVFFMIAFLLICFTGVLGHIANGAHLMGLGIGCALGVAKPKWKRKLPRRQ